MRVTTLLGRAGRMQRITEEEHPGEAGRTLRRDVRGDAAAHRLAADEERQSLEYTSGRIDCCPPRRFEHGRLVWRAAFRRHVGKVERRGADPSIGHSLREPYHEGAVSSRTGAMSDHAGGQRLFATVECE